MDWKTRFLKRMMMVAALVAVMLAVLVYIGGCGREQPQQASTPEHPSEAQTQTDVVAIEQKTCPVMEGNPINKNIFVEYKGKKVYFCCKGCPDTFKANPEKYVSKLPQFQN